MRLLSSLVPASPHSSLRNPKKSLSVRKSPMSSVTQTYGANTAFIEDLYERYRANPNSVSTSWQEFFHDYEPRFEEEFEEEADVQLAAAGGTQAVAAAPVAPQPAPAPRPT